MMKTIIRLSGCQVIRWILGLMILMPFHLRADVTISPVRPLAGNLGTASVTNYTVTIADGQFSSLQTTYALVGGLYSDDLQLLSAANNSYPYYFLTGDTSQLSYYYGSNGLAAINQFGATTDAGQNFVNAGMFFPSNNANGATWAIWTSWTDGNDVTLHPVFYNTNTSEFSSYSAISNYRVLGATAAYNDFYLLNNDTNVNTNPNGLGNPNNITGITNTYLALTNGYILIKPPCVYAGFTNQWLIYDSTIGSVVFRSTNNVTWVTNVGGLTAPTNVALGSPSIPTVTSNTLVTNYSGALRASTVYADRWNSQDGFGNVQIGQGNTFGLPINRDWIPQENFQNGAATGSIFVTNNLVVGDKNSVRAGYNLIGGQSNIVSDDIVNNYNPTGGFLGNNYNIVDGERNVIYGGTTITVGASNTNYSNADISVGNHISNGDGLNVIVAQVARTTPIQNSHYWLGIGDYLTLRSTTGLGIGSQIDITGTSSHNSLSWVGGTLITNTGVNEISGGSRINNVAEEAIILNSGTGYTNVAGINNDDLSIIFKHSTGVVKRFLGATNSPTDNYLPIATGNHVQWVSAATAVGSSFVASSSGNATNMTSTNTTFNGNSTFNNATASRVGVFDSGSRLTNSAVTTAQLNVLTNGTTGTGPIVGQTNASLTTPTITTPTLNGLGAITASSFKGTNGTTQYSVGGRVFVLTNSITVTNAASTTLINGNGNGLGTTNLSANFFSVGDTLWLHIEGECSGGVSATITNDFLIAGQTVSSGTIQLFAAGTVQRHWQADIRATCRKTGASGTLEVGGNVTFNNVATAVANTVDGGFPASGSSLLTVDTTGTIAVDYRSTTASGVGQTANICLIKLE